MSSDFWHKLLSVWSQFILVMSSPEGAKLLDMVEYLVKDVMDGPDHSPDYDPFVRGSSAPNAEQRQPRIVREPEKQP